MPTKHSVTHWVSAIKRKDELAAQKLWERYFPQLVRLARQKLCGSTRRVADEEDVALSAFDSFCRGAEQGKFPNLSDRNNLWKLLVVITARKAIDLIAWEHRKKHGSGKVRGEDVFHSPNGNENDRGIEQIVGDEPTPDFAMQVAEEYERLLDILDDGNLRSIATWKMEAYTNEEIAQKLNCAIATVERKLRLIRKLWTRASVQAP